MLAAARINQTRFCSLIAYGIGVSRNYSHGGASQQPAQNMLPSYKPMAASNVARRFWCMDQNPLSNSPRKGGENKLLPLLWMKVGMGVICLHRD
ncbi:MAG: hypothetical protein DSY88_03490 [Candidatus Poseidoniales archaeon]|nr:MAG: hypothetical protein DSY88_03490 [Candidatus Poseidoniales archaeon]